MSVFIFSGGIPGWPGVRFASVPKQKGLLIHYFSREIKGILSHPAWAVGNNFGFTRKKNLPVA
jgi:hypothetical protein